MFIVSLLLATCKGDTGSDEEGLQRTNLTIATATPGGTYYPVGVGIGNLVTTKLQTKGISASTVNSAGSGENLQMLKNYEVQMAILQSLFGAMAYEGRGLYEGKRINNFRSITMLWENVEHFVLFKEYARNGNMNDLRGLGRKFSIGKRGSGSEGSGLAILDALGVDVEKDFVMEHLAYGASANAMQDGGIVGANLPAGPPVAAVTRLFALLKENPYTIPANTYPGQTREYRTISQPNFLACLTELPEETVYEITKAIYENLPLLHGVHKATMAMSLERATLGLPAPLHPGAVRYYKEQGMDIPSHLLR